MNTLITTLLNLYNAATITKVQFNYGLHFLLEKRKITNEEYKASIIK